MSHWTEDQRDDAIEEMMGMARYVEDFLFQGEVDPTETIRLLMSRDVPLNNREPSDDHLKDAYDEQRDLFRAAFVKYANGSQAGQHSSRVETYLNYQHQTHMEDAA